MCETDARWSGHPPMSVRHVMELVALAPQVPSHLLKTLLCLAVMADHKTGLVRPAGRQETVWGIKSSTWGDQVHALMALGWVEQTVKGNKNAQRAAEYRLTMPGLPEESTNPADRLPSRREGSSSSPTATATPTPEGRSPAHRIPPPLTAAEEERWDEVKEQLLGGLTPDDRARLNESIKTMDQGLALWRAMLRLHALGAGPELAAAVAERRGPGPSVFSGVAHPARALWTRVREVAERHGVDMRDPSEALMPPDAPGPVPEVNVEGQEYLNSIALGVGSAHLGVDRDQR